MNAVYWIEHLNLHPHPEGGYYKETFRSTMTVHRDGESSIHNASTSIYYLLQDLDYSGFHRINSDELWYFHKGEALLIHVIDEASKLETHELSDELSGSLSVAVRGGCWFASEIKSKRRYSLVSCNVAPGFDFSEFEMAEKKTMLERYPDHADVINRLCRV